jgi:hypothetical protein
MIEVKAFRTFIRNYSLLKSERLSATIKLTLHKALIRSVITYACAAWELDYTFHHWKGSDTPNIKYLRTELTCLEHHKLLTITDRAKQFLQRVSL